MGSWGNEWWRCGWESRDESMAATHDDDNDDDEIEEVRWRNGIGRYKGLFRGGGVHVLCTRVCFRTSRFNLTQNNYLVLT